MPRSAQARVKVQAFRVTADEGAAASRLRKHTRCRLQGASVKAQPLVLGWCSVNASGPDGEPQEAPSAGSRERVRTRLSENGHPLFLPPRLLPRGAWPQASGASLPNFHLWGALNSKTQGSVPA